MKSVSKIILILLCILANISCKKQASAEEFQPMPFSADSAYQYIADQIAFGARVPDTEAHNKCTEYLTTQLSRFGAVVEPLCGTMPNYENQPQNIHNIIGHLRFGNTNRSAILLCAHFDSRPWADNEQGKENEPVLGANDGASGVGVLLEIARQISLIDTGKIKLPNIDIIFFDCEDMGTPSFYEGKHNENSWCLGSQLWAQQNTTTYQFGILLDMVGAPDATFQKEYYSMQYAAGYVENIWRTAQKLGYGKYFVNKTSYPITDDHYYINTIAKIPCLDIIHYDASFGTGFPEFWHTTHDDMTNIDRTTLQVVGTTILTAICSK